MDAIFDACWKKRIEEILDALSGGIMTRPGVHGAPA